MIGRLLGACAIAFVLCGCSSWRPIGLTPEAIVDREHPKSLRIAGGPKGPVTLKQPRVEGDSLVGTVEGQRHAIALRDVTWSEVRRCDSTAARVFVPLLLAMGTVMLGIGIYGI